MKLQKLFIALYLSIIILLITLAFFSFLLLQNQHKLKRSYEIQYKSIAIAEELKHSSDDLTRFCRTYVLTGDSVWENKYWEILDIRNGKKIRPDGNTISLHDSMQRLNFTKVEFAKLKEAKDNSNNLVNTEKRAFDAMKGFYQDKNGNFIRNTPDTSLARTILFDKKYLQDKQNIMNPINDFFALLKTRTLKTTIFFEKEGDFFLKIIIFLINIIIIALTIAFFILKPKVIRQIKELRKSKNYIVEQKEQYKVLSENTIMAIVIHDVQGNIIYANPKTFDILKIKDTKSVCQIPIFKFIHPDYLIKVTEALKEIFKNNKTLQTEQKFVTEDGIAIDVEVFAKAINYKNEQAIQIIFNDITKRKNAESLLFESESKFRGLFGKSGNALLILENEKIVNCNNAAIELLGYKTKKAFLNTHPSQISPEFQPDGLNSYEKAEKMISTALKNRTHRFEWTHKKSNGDLFPCEILLTVISDKLNKKIIHSVIRDISYQKNYQKKLLKLSAIVEQSFSTIILTDLNGNIEYVNPAFEKTTGYTFEEVKGKNIRILKSDNLVDYVNLWETISKGNTWVGEFLNIKKNKKEYWEKAIISSIKNEKGEIINYLAIKYDITDQKITEDALFQSEAHLRLSHKAGKIGTWEWTIKNDSLIWSDQTYLIFGLDKTEQKITTNQFFELVHPKDIKRIVTELDISLELNKKELQTEYRIFKNKEIVWIKETSEIITDENGKLLKMIGIMQDITNEKLAKSLLEKAKKDAQNANKLKSEFLANMSHEIRTPMNAIIGFSEILQNKIENEKHKSFIDKIVLSGNNLLKLINDILDLSKIEAGQIEIQKEATNLLNIFNEIPLIFSEISKEKQVPINIDIKKGLPNFILIDENRLRQILLNLVSNAIKFTSEGSVSVIVKTAKSSKNNRINLNIKVKDTGIGIPKDQLNIVFDSFRQVKGQSSKVYGGTGLGLAITKSLVELMGGTISVKSTVGIGSIFKVIFEDIEIIEQNNTLYKEIEEENIILKKSKILLVEDIDFNREIISLYLENEDVEIVEATTGEYALELLKTIKPDLIIMDIQLPKMDGYETTKIIRKKEKTKSIPIIALTANATREEINKYSHVFDMYLTKPINRKIFISALSKYLI